MHQARKIVSAVTSSFIASLPFVVALDLLILHFGVSQAFSATFNLGQLFFIDAAFIALTLFVAGHFGKQFTSPLLHFCQSMIQKLFT